MSQQQADYLGADGARQVLRTALGRDRCMFCHKTEATYASGAAAAAMATKSLQEALAQVCDILDARAGEMYEEKIFVREVLERHIIQLRRVIGLLLGLMGHLATKSCRALPETEGIRQGVENADSFLEMRLLEPMEQMLQAKRTEAAALRELLTKRGPVVVATVLAHPAMLRGAQKQVEEVLARLQLDWEMQAGMIYKDPVCRGG